MPNGKLTAIFVENKYNFRNYDCLLCSVHDLNMNNLISHASGKKHKDNVDLVDIDDYVDIDTTSEDSLPRYKGKIETLNWKNFEMFFSLKGNTSQLQVTIDETTNVAIIGLEYILDVQSNSKSSYHCILCERIFCRISSVIDHLTSSSHRLNYLVSLLIRRFQFS